MPLREQTRTSLVLSIAALALAILAGAVIAISGGRGNAATLRWTPPAPTIAPNPSPSRTPTATAAPTLLPTVTSAPTVTPTAKRATATTAPSATRPVAAAVEPQARILQGPANLRAGPGRDFGVARVANEGETFAVTGRTEDGAWLRLCCVNDAPVWVAGELVEMPAGANVPVVK